MKKKFMSQLMFTLWSSSMTVSFVCNLLYILQQLGKWEHEGLCTKKKKKVKEYRKYNFCLNIFCDSNLDSLQRLQHGRKKDYKISLIYFLGTKISKQKLKIKIMSTDCCCSRVHFWCLLRKKKKAQNLFASV